MNQSFFTRRSFAIVMVTVFLLPFLFVGSRRAMRSNRNDIKEWLPEGFQETADHRWFQKHFPHEQFVLISWEGCTLNDPRLELFARKLVPKEVEGPADGEMGDRFAPRAAEKPEKPPLFNSVLTGPRLIDELLGRYESLSEEDAIDRLEGTLIGEDGLKTCLVVTLTEAAKGTNLRSTLEEIRRIASEECNIKEDEIRLGGPPVDNVAIDVEGERTLMRLAALSAIVGLGISMLCFRSVRLTLMVFWVALLSAGMGLSLVYFTGSNVDAILLSMPSLVYVLALSGAVHIINYYHDAVREGGLPGAPERALRHAVRPCTIAALTTALGLGSLVASKIIPISKFGVFSALGVLGSLYMLFLYLPALLHYFPSRQYAEEVAGSRGRSEKEKTVLIRWWRTVGGLVVRHNVWVAGGCMAVMVFFLVGVTRMETSVKLMKLFSPEAEIIAHYGWLEKHLGPLVPMEVVVRVDNEKCKLSFVDRMRLAQSVERAVERLKDVGGALSAATFAPDIRPSARRPTVAERIMGFDPRRDRDVVLNKRLEPHRAEFREHLAVDIDRMLTDDPTLRHLRITGELAEALEGEGLTSLSAIQQHGDLASIEGIGPEGAKRVAEAIAAWKAARNPTIEQLGITGEIAERLKARKLNTLDSIERHGEIEYIDGIGPEGADKVAKAIEDWRIAHGEELWRVSARVNALTDLDYAFFLDELREAVEPVLAYYREHGVEGIDATYTGLVPLVYKAQHELMNGLYESLALAFGLIALVMIFVLRSPSAGLLAMIPNVFPVVVIFGLMGWLGVLVDVGSMMTASVALGVAVDDTIHYLTWYREGLDKGLSRKGAVMLAYERCATAMTQTTLIAGLGLAAFAFSTFTPTQRFGILMLTLLVAALFGDLIFLPALLTSPIGRFFRGGRKAAMVKSAEPSAVEGESGEDVVAVPIEGSSGTLHLRPDAAHRSHKAS